MNGPYQDEDPGPGARPPPAEQALLGLLLRGEAAWPSELASPADFADPAHTIVATAMRALADMGHGADRPLVEAALETAGRLDDIGGHDYLAKLAAGAATVARLGDYCGTIRADAAKRRAHAAIDRGDLGAARDHIEAAADGSGKARLPTTFTAAALGAMVFNEPRWAVPDLLPEGLGILAGRPKMGKSWLALALGAAVASGGYALGKIRVIQGEVLYLALEDRERRLRSRLEILLEDAEFPERLTFATTWPRGDTGVTAIRAWLDQHRDARLVVIDTLARFREPDKGKGSAYAGDYDALSGLQSLAVERGICILLIHHLRKMAADDPMDTISGTLGITGACDAVMVLARERGAADAVLHITGRDIEDAQHALRWEPASCLWTIIGDAAAVRVSRERREILDLLAAGPMYPKQIAESLGKARGTVRKILRAMFAAGEVAANGDLYHTPFNGNTGNAGNTGNSGNTGNRGAEDGHVTGAVTDVTLRTVLKVTPEPSNPNASRAGVTAVTAVTATEVRL